MNNKKLKKQETQVETISIHSNGIFCCFDKNGEQIGELQNKGWIELLLEYIESKGVDPTKVKNIETVVNGHKKYINPHRTEKGWKLNFTDF